MIENSSYFRQVVLQSEVADSIIAAADRIPIYENRQVITKRLLPLLTDSIRGIAIHYVLCAIWKRRTGIYRGGFGTSEITYHELTFYYKDGQYVADQGQLLANQQRWAKFIRQ